MSEETKLKLIRQDKYKKLDSYTSIYDSEPLSILNEQEKSNILQIIKKSILGCNFSYHFLLHFLIFNSISNFLIITSIIIFSYALNEIFNKSYTNITNQIVLMTINFIINFIHFISNLNHKKKTITNYMKKITQCAIKEENDILIKNKLYCEISENDFSLEIKCPEKSVKYKLNKEEIFFKYSINYANGLNITKALYDKAFTDKENEIINNINSMLKEIISKEETKLGIYLMTALGILGACFMFCHNQLFKINMHIINIILTFFLVFLIKYYFSLQIIKQEIKSVSSLNEKYIKDGYYIYIDANIISIFCLKEENRINGNIQHIKEMNEKLMKKISQH